MPYAQLADNLRMYYELDDFTDPWTTPETVVLHHGNAKNGRLFYRWIPVLAQHYRVVRLDARGFGRSTVPPPGYPWSLSQFARDIRNLLDYLGLERVHLVGETVGGTFSLQFAYEYPERLKSLTICISPYNFVGQATYVDYAKKVQAEGTMAWAKETVGNRVGASPNPAFAEWYANQMGQTQPHVVIETLQALTKVDLTPILPKIRVPTLIMAAGERLAGLGPGPGQMQQLIPKAKLVTFPDESGFVQHTAPERCAQECMRFWSSL